MLALRPVWQVPATPADTAGQAGLGNILEHLGNFLSTSIPPLHFLLEELKLNICVSLPSYERLEVLRQELYWRKATSARRRM